MRHCFGWNGETSKLALLRECGVNRLLVSYAILRDHADGRWPERTDLTRFAGMDLLIDSGAFSAFRSRKPISLDEYRAFLDLQTPQRYITLDVIGDWRATVANLRELENTGYNPIPVWHPQDPWELLGELTSSYSLIALGGLVPLSSTVRASTLRRVFGDYPHAYHGLGIGSPHTLQAYAWASCDSTSWDLNSIFWKVQGWQDKWTPRRRRIRKILDVEQAWQVPPAQATWSF